MISSCVGLEFLSNVIFSFLPNWSLTTSLINKFLHSSVSQSSLFIFLLFPVIFSTIHPLLEPHHSFIQLPILSFLITLHWLIIYTCYSVATCLISSFDFFSSFFPILRILFFYFWFLAKIIFILFSIPFLITKIYYSYLPFY